MKGMCLVFLIFISPLIYANDGALSMAGDTLHPVNNTDVSMDYERLNIIYNKENNNFIIEAYIELYNHTNSEMELLMGFEFEDDTSSIGGERIDYKTLLVNGEPQEYESKAIDTDPGNLGGKYNVLTYSPILVPGINTVYHYYIMYPGYGSLAGYGEYILKTGGRWKDGIIKDFELFIRTTESTMIRFPVSGLGSFDSIGESRKIDDDFIDDVNLINKETYSLTPNGYLYKIIRDFRPEDNLIMIIRSFENRERYVYYMDDNIYIALYWCMRLIENSDSSESAKQISEKLRGNDDRMLRLLRNGLYAMKGFVFQDRNLQEYFSNQYWYFPNSKIHQNNMGFTEAETKLLEYIVEEENRRKIR